MLRVGQTVLPAGSVIQLAARVATGGCSWDAIDFVFRNFNAVRARACGRLQVSAQFDAQALRGGLLELARRRYGPEAADRLESMGLRRSEDIGRVVYALVAAGLLKVQESDRQEDFAGVVDVRAALANHASS